MRRIAKRIGDRFLGAPEGATLPQLRRILQFASGGMKIRALRELGYRRRTESVELVRAGIDDPLPGVRRSSAHALGLLEDRTSLPIILDALERERCDEVCLGMAVAAVRLGLPVAAGWGRMERQAGRRISSWYGARDLGEVVGFGRVEVARRWRLALAPLSQEDPDEITPVDPEKLRVDFRRRIKEDLRNIDGLEALGAQQHPEDLEILLKRTGRRGRKESHAAVHALGLNGDPRAIRSLGRQLRGLGVDPGHGFQARRAAGLALGRIGDPVVAGVMVRALEDEALEYEGRPGAGLGIQIPVRSVLLYALGEAGARDQIGLLIRYLSNTHGSVMGGFYLPAMDALVKLHAVDELAVLVRGPELVAANALGVLGMLGEASVVRESLRDPRPRVASAARQALESG